MTDFGLKRRLYPEDESLQLDQDLCIGAETVRVLTNFQIEALRFLWSQQKQKSRRCLYNDGRHMGKRLTLVALITALVRVQGQRVLIACDTNEAIVSWMFKLKVLGDSSHASTVYSTAPGNRRLHPPSESSNNCPITFTNFTQCGLSLNKVILQNDFSFVILDIGSAKGRDLKFTLDLPSDAFLVVVYSPDIASRPQLLHGLLRMREKQWPSIRRTNEDHLREFPWLDQRQFQVKFQEWQGHRTTSDILSQREVPEPIPVDDEGEEEEERVLTATPVAESQVMSQLLFETDDEGTPVKRQMENRRLARPSLLSSMYLRVSQSFANTPSQRTIAPTIAQDSPDLFASMLNDSDSEEDQLEAAAKVEEGEDCQSANPFYTSQSETPLTIRERATPSQSPMSMPNEEDPDKSDVFEITTNEVFATKIKITTSQKYIPVDDEREQLKFAGEETHQAIHNQPNHSPRTPKKTKRQSSGNTTPTSSGWLSKRNTPKIPTPEKVLAKKRRSVLQFYATGGSGSGSFRGNLDFAVLDDDNTQRWNACDRS